MIEKPRTNEMGRFAKVDCYIELIKKNAKRGCLTSSGETQQAGQIKRNGNLRLTLEKRQRRQSIGSLPSYHHRQLKERKEQKCYYREEYLFRRTWRIGLWCLITVFGTIYCVQIWIYTNRPIDSFEGVVTQPPKRILSRCMA